MDNMAGVSLITDECTAQHFTEQGRKEVTYGLSIDTKIDDLG